jgi:hypothetical protein
MKRKQTPEGQLLRLVLDWLAAKHIFSLRMNSGTLINQAGRPVTFGVPGCADILAFPRLSVSIIESSGRPVITPFPVWIELKAPKGKQSKLQKSFQAKVEAEGHRYILARTLEDIEAVLR